MATFVNNIINSSMYCLLLVILLSLPIQIFSQVNDIDDEILVYILPDSLELPDGTTELMDASKLNIKSKDLDKTFKKIELKSIKKAFPDFKINDTLKISGGGEKIKLPNISRIFKLKLKNKNDLNTAIKLLSDEKSILFAEMNGIAVPSSTIPNDQYFSFQWGLKNGTTGRDIHATEAWDIYKGSSSNIIAIIDGGINKTHPDLNGKVSGDDGIGWDGHGIHVAGIAAAKTNNTTGIAGVDWYANLHSQRVDNTDDIGTYNAIIDAVNYSSTVRVLNNSWALVNYPSYSPRYSTTVRLAFAYAFKMNRVAVCAMGNHQLIYPNQTYYPAGFGQGILSVGATNSNDIRRASSSVGNHIDVSAPGENIYSTYNNNSYEYISGTSMATPHVAGVASLLKGYKSNLANDDIENIIRISADDVNSSTYPGWDQYLGTGRVNAKKALDLLRMPNYLMQNQSTGGTIVSSTGYLYRTFYGLPGSLPDGQYIAKRHTVEKTVTYSGNYYQNPYVWGRGVSTVGYSADITNFTMGYCEVVQGTITKTSAKLRTYIYDLYVEDPYEGTMFIARVPAEPNNVVFAYTTLGKSGIQKLDEDQANISELNEYKLFDNYPNPFNPSTTISYQLKESGHVSLKVYDILGKEIAELVNEFKDKGSYESTLNASALSSGIYFYRIKVNDFISSKKMLLTK